MHLPSCPSSALCNFFTHFVCALFQVSTSMPKKKRPSIGYQRPKKKVNAEAREDAEEPEDDAEADALNEEVDEASMEHLDLTSLSVADGSRASHRLSRSSRSCASSRRWRRRPSASSSL